jgi:hypothetical protein
MVRSPLSVQNKNAARSRDPRPGCAALVEPGEIQKWSLVNIAAVCLYHTQVVLRLLRFLGFARNDVNGSCSFHPRNFFRNDRHRRHESRFAMWFACGVPPNAIICFVSGWKVSFIVGLYGKRMK